MIQIRVVNTALFWKDLWSDQPLETTYPRAFSFAREEDVSVQKLLRSCTIGEAFHIPISPQARVEVEEIQALTAEFNPESDRTDKWCCVWDAGGLGTFKSSDYYKFSFKDVPIDEGFPWIWESKCTNKWKVFAWMLFADRLNTRNMLRRTQYKLEGDVYTFLLCDTPPEETVAHLFFKCPFATKCWDAIGMHWHDSQCRLELIHGGKKSWGGPLFMETFIIAIWGVWKERNNKNFRNMLPSFESWRDRFRNDMSMMMHRTRDSLHPFIRGLVASV